MGFEEARSNHRVVGLGEFALIGLAVASTHPTTTRRHFHGADISGLGKIALEVARAYIYPPASRHEAGCAGKPRHPTAQNPTAAPAARSETHRLGFGVDMIGFRYRLYPSYNYIGCFEISVCGIL